MATASSSRLDQRSTLKVGNSVLRILVLAVLFASLAVVEVIRLNALTDLDVWMHLRTGQWILQNHSLPRTILFSQSSGLPWAVSNWAFDLALGVLYKLSGLSAIPMMMMIARVLIAVALFFLARSSRRDFWFPVLISAVAQFALIDLPAGPLAFGVVLFALELLILFRARQTGETRPLLFLPLLFLIWANLDWHFVIGLLSLLLFTLVTLAEHFRPQSNHNPPRCLSITHVVPITLASAIATLLSPYSYHSYEVAFSNTFSGLAVGHFPDLRAIPFRHPQDFVTILLVMFAFFALGRRRSRDIFSFALLATCAFLSFRFQRESWMIVVASVAILGDAPVADSEPAPQPHTPQWARVATAVLVLFSLIASASRIQSRDRLLEHVAHSVPVHAAEFIRSNRLPAPLFNSIEWGGFLSWFLPEYPVAVDLRIDAYEEQVQRYFETMQGEIPLDNDPSFANAQTILLDKNSSLAKALTTFPNFRVEYKDDLATVFVRK